MVRKLDSAEIASLAGPLAGESAGTRAELLLDFMEFIDSGGARPLGDVLHRVLYKARRLTDAEAGAIFVARGRGNHRTLESGSLQNDALHLTAQRVMLPAPRASIAGYVALTG